LTDTIFVMVALMLEDLPPELKRLAKGATKVARIHEVVTYTRQEEDGGATLVLTFVLADPPAGMDTWPVEELWELRRIAREVVPSAIAKVLADAAQQAGTTVEALPSFSWTVEFKPEHMPTLEADDESIVF
jgi:hypothetical protein